MKVFDVADWFWIVGGDASKVWSSAAAGYVQTGAAAYASFLDDGNHPQTSESMEALLALFAAQCPSGSLLTYANFKQWNVATGGYVATVGELQIPFKTDVSSLSLITGKVVSITQPDGPQSVDWQVGPYSIISIEADDFLAAARAVDIFVQGTFTTLKTVFEKIADGTFTTRDQIDQAFA